MIRTNLVKRGVKVIKIIQEHLDTSIAILTLIVSVSVIFLGLGDNKKNKQEQLKFVLMSYSIIILIILFSSQIPVYIFGLLLLFFFLGGLSYSLNDSFDLEKELNIPQLLIYSSFSWFFITNNFFLFFSILVVYLLKCFTIFDYYFSLIIVSVSLIFQYLSIVKDYFNINEYTKTFKKLEKINLYTKNAKQAKDVFEDEFLTDKLQLVAFTLYVEDRYLFNRKKFHITIKNLLDSRKDPVIFKDKIKYEKTSFLDKYTRGYSTLEQQLIRQYSIGSNAYRYKYRRKIFFDWIYTPLFSKAICRRKSKVYGKEKKIAKKELIWNLKMMYLYNYFTIILKNPNDKDELILNMNKQSRVSINVYEKMFELFENSPKEHEMKEIIQKNVQKKYNFY